jgi:hypothetical protein
MPFPSSAGHPNYSGNFIPEIWSGKILEKFYDATVLAQIANTDYEGEIKKFGDKVHIRTRPTVAIRDYVKGQSLTVDHPDSAGIELLIDKGKYYSFVQDDVDKVQSDVDLLNLWGQDASEQMKIVVDSDVLNGIYPDFAAKNRGATAGRLSNNINLGTTGAPIALDKTNVIDKLIDLGQVFDEQNIPETGRWLILPAWASALLKKSDLKDASLTGDGTSVMRNGRLGMIDRFTVYGSNLLPTAVDGANTVTRIMAGHKVGLTFASQFVNTETLRAESTFGSIVRGLKVYGYEVVKPEALAELYAYKA